MANDFCRRLSNTARFMASESGGLIYQPCCWVPASDTSVTDRRTIMMARDEVTDLVMSDTEKWCGECLTRERDGHSKSHRLSARGVVPISAENHDLYEIDVQVDNTCNAACVMCGPQFSSLWHRQFNHGFQPKDVSAEYDVIRSTAITDKLRHISFLGGEPFLSEHNFRLLDDIENPEEVSIYFSTNASVWPDRSKIDVLKRFKKVLLGLSIDGMNDQFEYIRWPLKWKKVSENIKRFRELYDSELTGTMNINFTANPVNILHYQDLVEWFAPYRDPLSSLSVEISSCFGEWALDAAPQKLREWISANLGDDHLLTRLVASYPEVPGKWESLRERMRELDWTRGLTHETVFGRTLSIVG